MTIAKTYKKHYITFSSILTEQTFFKTVRIKFQMSLNSSEIVLKIISYLENGNVNI